MVKSSDEEPAKTQLRVGGRKDIAKAFGTEDSKLRNHRMLSLVNLMKFDEGDDSHTKFDSGFCNTVVHRYGPER
jgi:hypothetical protein